MQFFIYQLAAVAFLCHSTDAHIDYGHKQRLPVVDLGYELHRASYFNETGGFYNFSNVRYAAPRMSCNERDCFLVHLLMTLM